MIKIFKIITILFLTTVIFIVSSNSASAFFGNSVAKVTRETIEYTARKFGIKLGEAGGKQFFKKAVRFITDYGDDGIKALKHAGPQIIEMTSRHGRDVVRICASHVDDEARYLIKNINEALPVWRSFGKEGTGLIVRYPGLAKPLIEQFGQKGIQFGRSLSTDSLQKFLVMAGKAANKKEKDALFEKVLKYGDEILEFLWRHKWKLASGTTLYTLLKEYEKGFVTTITDSDGKIIEKNHTNNFFQHITTNILNKTLANYPWLSLLFIVIVICWLWPLLKSLWSIPKRIKALLLKIKTEMKKNQTQKEVSCNQTS